MDIHSEIRTLLEETLDLCGRANSFSSETPLLGALPELDSMSVIALLNEIEVRFGIHIDDEEIDGSVFATVGSLESFLKTKLGVSKAP